MLLASQIDSFMQIIDSGILKVTTFCILLVFWLNGTMGISKRLEKKNERKNRTLVICGS